MVGSARVFSTTTTINNNTDSNTCNGNDCNSSSIKHHGGGLTIDGQLELKELADVVVHPPAPHDSPHNGREPVIEDNYVGRVLGHLFEGGGGARDW